MKLIKLVLYLLKIQRPKMCDEACSGSILKVRELLVKLFTYFSYILYYQPPICKECQNTTTRFFRNCSFMDNCWGKLLTNTQSCTMTLSITIVSLLAFSIITISSCIIMLCDTNARCRDIIQNVIGQRDTLDRNLIFMSLDRIFMSDSQTADVTRLHLYMQ